LRWISRHPNRYSRWHITHAQKGIDSQRTFCYISNLGVCQRENAGDECLASFLSFLVQFYHDARFLSMKLAKNGAFHGFNCFFPGGIPVRDRRASRVRGRGRRLSESK
jgi:hypothetical protein